MIKLNCNNMTPPRVQGQHRKLGHHSTNLEQQITDQHRRKNGASYKLLNSTKFGQSRPRYYSLAINIRKLQALFNNPSIDLEHCERLSAEILDLADGMIDKFNVELTVLNFTLDDDHPAAQREEEANRIEFTMKGYKKPRLGRGGGPQDWLHDHQEQLREVFGDDYEMETPADDWCPDEYRNNYFFLTLPLRFRHLVWVYDQIDPLTDEDGEAVLDLSRPHSAFPLQLNSETFRGSLSYVFPWLCRICVLSR